MAGRDHLDRRDVAVRGGRAAGGGCTHGRADPAMGQAIRHCAAGFSGLGGVVADGELIVGELRAIPAEDQGQVSVGREHHHPRSVASGNRRKGPTHILGSVDDIYSRQPSTRANVIRDEGPVFDPAAPTGGGGVAAATQQDQTGGQQEYKKNQGFFQTWDSNLMRDNHLDARKGL